MISAMISINSIIIYQNFCVFKGENLIQIHNLVNFIIENNKKIGLQLRIEISARFSVNFQFRAEVKKVTSRAEYPSARANHYYLHILLSQCFIIVCIHATLLHTVFAFFKV